MGIKAIDLFSGLGGFSEGARQAGADVLWAANHWPEAVALHEANHPETIHLCQDLHQADFSVVPDHDMLLASPACQGHAWARGKERAHHDTARSTAWAVVSAAEAKRPPVLLVENVPEFRSWLLYPTWKEALQTLGYALSEIEIDAADLGVPQHRKRLFVVATQSMAPLDLQLDHRPHVPASDILDLDTGNWSQVDRPGRAAKTLEIIRRSRTTIGETFLLPYYGSTRVGRSLCRPLGTLTTRARYAIVDGDRMRMLTIPECRRAMGFPESYRLPRTVTQAHKMLGNAVCPPVASALVEAVSRAA